MKQPSDRTPPQVANRQICFLHLGALWVAGTAFPYFPEYREQHTFFGKAEMFTRLVEFADVPSPLQSEAWLTNTWPTFHPEERQVILEDCCTVLGMPIPDKDLPDVE